MVEHFERAELRAPGKHPLLMHWSSSVCFPFGRHVKGHSGKPVPIQMQSSPLKEITGNLGHDRHSRVALRSCQVRECGEWQGSSLCAVGESLTDTQPSSSSRGHLCSIQALRAVLQSPDHTHVVCLPCGSQSYTVWSHHKCRLPMLENTESILLAAPSNFPVCCSHHHFPQVTPTPNAKSCLNYSCTWPANQYPSIVIYI